VGDHAAAYSNATAYSENVMAIRDINVGMTSNAVYACDALMSSLKFFVLQTGTNVGHLDHDVSCPVQHHLTDSTWV
jgi:nucleoside-diphosphate-sugar epimerase